MSTDDSIIDSHCHIDMVFGRDIDHQTVVDTMCENRVSGLVQIGADPDAMIYARDFAHSEKNFSVHYTVGAHPGEAHEIDASFGENFAREHRDDEKFVAIGEIGLDYYYGPETAEDQKAVFIRYVKLANELNKPVCIHTRDAHRDTIDILRQYAETPVLIHCFTGSRDEMLEFVDFGCTISYSGIVTFKNAQALREAALDTPLEKMLVETDAPYLAPVPKRGRANQPGYVRHTLEMLAELRGVEPAELARITRENTLEFYRISREEGSQ